MRESNKKWLSAGTSFIIGQQKIGTILDTMDAIHRAVTIANDINLRKRVIGIKKLPDNQLQIKWEDPNTKKQWTEILSLEKFEAWEKIKNNI